MSSKTQELELDTQKLSNFPGIELALGWINAAHDYKCMLDLETLLRRLELENEDLILPENYSFYCARLRASQTREAVGLCQPTKGVPELMFIICGDQEAKEHFHRLETLTDTHTQNADMETIRLVRDTTFHYCMRQHKDWYQDVFKEFMSEGRTRIRIQTTDPDRFSPADDLLNRVFLKQALGIPDLSDEVACGKRMAQVTAMLVDVGHDFQVVARAIGRGLISACSLNI